jgi:hypothetical protein
MTQTYPFAAPEATGSARSADDPEFISLRKNIPMRGEWQEAQGENFP